MEKKSKKLGRPPIYRAAFDEQAGKLAWLGATNAGLADFFGVAKQTIDYWLAHHPTFLGAVKEGRENADLQIVKSLFHRAKGYSHPAVKIVADAKTGAEHIVEYTEHYPPDSTACIFWLKNRRPQEWRDKRIQELSGPGDGPVAVDVTGSVAGMPSEEIAALRELLEKVQAKKNQEPPP